jgi:AraC-like DNA-binding protein
VTLPSAAPRSPRPFIEAFGTRQVEFGAPASSVTFGPADLAAPMTGADPLLAGILRDYTAPVTPPTITFLEAFDLALADTIRGGRPTLQEVADRLAMSSRTLQRRLGEHGTCWRAELEAARRGIAYDRCGVKMASLARQLGYADSRSLRRALRRWETAGDCRRPVSDGLVRRAAAGR